MEFKNKLIILFFLMILILNQLFCYSYSVTKNPKIINVNYQKIYLHPLQGTQAISMSDYWPLKDSIGNLLLNYLQQVWKKLYAEFRLCEKYGFYTMVDSSESHTMEIFLKILSSEFREDTLSIPIEIAIIQKMNSTKYDTTIAAFGICPTRIDSTTPMSLQQLVSVFDDYTRRFPYKEVVSPFYTDPQ